MTTVVLSLVFVGFELRQSNEIAVRDARNAIIEKLDEIQRLRIESSLLREVLAKLSQQNPELDFDESVVADSYVQLWISYWGSIQVAQDSGFLPEAVYQVYRNGIGNEFERHPGISPYVEARLNNVGVGPQFAEIYSDLFNEINKYK